MSRKLGIHICFAFKSTRKASRPLRPASSRRRKGIDRVYRASERCSLRPEGERPDACKRDTAYAFGFRPSVHFAARFLERCTLTCNAQLDSDYSSSVVPQFFPSCALRECCSVVEMEMGFQVGLFSATGESQPTTLSHALRPDNRSLASCLHWESSAAQSRILITSVTPPWNLCFLPMFNDYSQV